MKFQHRVILTLTILLLTLFISACSSDSNSLIETKNLNAVSDEEVTIKASNAEAYVWTQVSGVEVVLINADTSTLSFIAPEVQTEEILVFELEALMASVIGEDIIKKERATVTVSPLEIITDNNETNTTNQATITLKSISLTIDKTSLNLDENTTLNAVQITKHKLITKHDKNIILQAKLNAVTSNAVALEIYQEINGHRLPPMPDETLNNSTLLGIDANGNGVRDDVERWIYTYYSKPIEHAVCMQSARAYQIVIQEPERALENLHYILDASDCKSYWSMSEEDARSEGEAFWLEEYKNYEKEIKPVQFNTADRFLAYKKFNQTLSAGVYSSSSLGEWKNRCDFNSSMLIKNP